MFALNTRALISSSFGRSLASAVPRGNQCYHGYHSKIKTTVLGGLLGTAAHRMYFEKSGAPISPWHDIPLVADVASNEYNMVCEIPRWSNAKLEIDTVLPFNPIKQDSKKGKPRYVADIFPYKGYIWNYGALPQTYEDPEHTDAETGCVGDGDPIDVIEVGQQICAQGSVHRVKVLGVVALIDDGETDWKVVALRTDDPLAPKIHSVGCLEKYMPGLMAATVDWFTKYKVPDGKPLNKWAFGSSAKDVAYAENVISATHEAWKKLVHLPQSKLSLVSTTVQSSPHCLLPSDASSVFKALTDSSPGQMYTDTPPKARADHKGSAASTKWHYIRGDVVANDTQ